MLNLSNKERLISLLQDSNNPVHYIFFTNLQMNDLADYLVNNGVVVKESEDYIMMELTKYVVHYLDEYPTSNQIQSCIIAATDVGTAVEHFYNTKHGTIVAVEVAQERKGMTEAC